MYKREKERGEERKGARERGRREGEGEGENMKYVQTEYEICANSRQYAVFNSNECPISAKSVQQNQYELADNTLYLMETNAKSEQNQRNLNETNTNLILVSLHEFCTDWVFIPIKYSALSTVCQNCFVVLL